MRRACEGLDDDHRGSAVSAHEGGLCAVRAGCRCGQIGGQLRCRPIQELASGGDVFLAVGVGEQPIVSDAVKA